MRIFKKVSSVFLTVALVFIALTLVSPDPAEAASPKISVGRALVTGAPLKLAMTSKYKNKRVVVEIGKLVRKKLKYTRLTSVVLNAGGSATFCTQTAMPSTSVLRVKYGSKILASTKTKSRSNLTPCPLAAPAALDLLSVSDSGVSDSDNVTNSSTVSLAGSAFPNSSVTLFDNGSTTGLTVPAGSNGEFSFTVSGAPSEGSHNYSVQASIASLTSPFSTPLVVSVDRTKPTLDWTWEEGEIGPNSFKHMNIVPSEPIFGFELSDVIIPNDPAYSMLVLSNLEKTNENYRFTVVANDYMATDLAFTMWAESIADAAGNYSAGTYTLTNGINSGRRITISGSAQLDIWRPELSGGSLELVDSVVDYGRINFSFDEEVYDIQLQDLSLRQWSEGWAGWTDNGYQSLTDYSTDGILHTTNNKDFWVGISGLQHYFFTEESASGVHYEVIVTDTIKDEYGNTDAGGNYGAFIN